MQLDISYLKPKTQQFLNKHSKYYIKSGSDGMIIRNVYEKVEYDEYEKTLIEEFKSKITDQLPNNWKISDYLKMLISANFQIPLALQNLQIHLNWLQQYCTMEPQINYLQTGDYYIFGIDKQSRPVLIISNLTLESFPMFQFLLETVKRQVLVPYYVENWTIILDGQNKDINLYEIDIGVEQIQQLMINFCGNLNILLIVNSTIELQQAQSFIPNKVQIHSKIKLIKNLDDLTQYIPKEQLEEKYGGECQNSTIFWPPQIPKVSELLKHVTLDIYEDYYCSLKRLQEFRGRNLRKFSSLGRMSQSQTKVASMKKSLESGSSSSHMKLIVCEENGNELIKEDINVGDNQDIEQDQIKQENKDNIDFQENQENFIERTQSQGLQQMRAETKSKSLKQVQTVLEAEQIQESRNCCSESKCVIF